METRPVTGWQFGLTLRQWRDRVQPADVGLTSVGQRRTPGLRREELAGLVGISTDYLTRLEQGRATSPSQQVVEAIARSLRLSDAERDLLFRLAGHAPMGTGLVPSRLTPSIQRLLDRLTGTPVAVYDATWTLIHSNAPYDALMGRPSAWRGLERNAIWRNFTGLPNRTVHTLEEVGEVQAGQLTDLRLTASRYPADRTVQSLISELRAASPRFEAMWESTPSSVPTTMAKHKVIAHPAVGHITLDCDVLFVATDDVRLMIYTAEPGTDNADRLALATVIGTQSLADETRR